MNHEHDKQTNTYEWTKEYVIQCKFNIYLCIKYVHIQSTLLYSQNK